MTIKSKHSLDPGLFFMNECGRQSTQRSYFCYESALPLGVRYEMVKAIADSLGNELPGMSASQQFSWLAHY